MKTVRVQNTTTTTTIQNSGQWTDDIRLFKFIDPSKTKFLRSYLLRQKCISLLLQTAGTSVVSRFKFQIY